jgi:hypothetical protein
MIQSVNVIKAFLNECIEQAELDSKRWGSLSVDQWRIGPELAEKYLVEDFQDCGELIRVGALIYIETRNMLGGGLRNKVAA